VIGNFANDQWLDTPWSGPTLRARLTYVVTPDVEPQRDPCDTDAKPRCEVKPASQRTNLSRPQRGCYGRKRGSNRDTMGDIVTRAYLRPFGSANDDLREHQHNRNASNVVEEVWLEIGIGAEHSTFPSPAI
jgi:hypothetical protein